MDTEINKNICSICKRKILKHAKKAYCYSCHRYVHRNCTGLTNVDFELAVSNTTWFCRICNDDIFPLNHLDDDDDFLKAVCEMSQTIDIILKIGNEWRLFHPFELNEEKNDISVASFCETWLFFYLKMSDCRNRANDICIMSMTFEPRSFIYES